MNRRPRWLRLAPFLGNPPELSARQWSVLGLVSIVSLFEMYDIYLFALNLKQIQADLGVPEGEIGRLAAFVHAGAIPALLVTLVADRLGRRRVLLFTVLAYTLLTGATAFAPSAEVFAALQFLARMFAVAEMLIAVVVIAEEFAPEHRGWGIGALGAIQACGAGLAALAFGLVDFLPYGWRALYALGLGPLLLVAYWRRKLPETESFERLRRARGDSLRSTPALAPAWRLLHTYPGRFAALAVVSVCFGLADGTAAFFAPKFLQDAHGWAPGAVALLNFGGGALAIVANPLAGRLSDRYGRRRITVLFTLAFALLVIVFYRLGAGFAMAPLWVLLIFFSFGSNVTLQAYSAEMFPTSQRATAGGSRSAFKAVGGVVGLALVSTLFGLFASNWTALAVLGAAALLVPLVVLLAFPETAGRSLDEVAPERDGATSPLDAAVANYEAGR